MKWGKMESLATARSNSKNKFLVFVTSCTIFAK